MHTMYTYLCLIPWPSGCMEETWVLVALYGGKLLPNLVFSGFPSLDLGWRRFGFPFGFPTYPRIHTP